MSRRIDHQKFKRRPVSNDQNWHVIGEIGRRSNPATRKQIAYVYRLQRELGIEEDLGNTNTKAGAMLLIKKLLSQKEKTQKKDKIIQQLKELQDGKNTAKQT